MRGNLKYLILFSWLSAGSFTLAFAAGEMDPVELPAIQDLSILSAKSSRANIPILLMFSEPHCSYCERLEDEVLKPMKRWAGAELQVLISKVEVGAGELLRGFAGETLSPDALADEYNIGVYPTLVLMDSRGTALVPNIVGYQTPEFYNAYLDAAISASHQLLAAEKINDK